MRRYEFKMFIGDTKNILCFHSHISKNKNSTTIKIIEIEGFPTNNIYKSVFDDIVKGELSFDLIKKGNSLKYQKTITIKINKGSLIKNLKEFTRYAKLYFCITTEFVKVVKGVKYEI